MKSFAPGLVTTKTNHFGYLRLAFASLVIAAHAPEIYDGNRNHELLTRVFGTLSFGELAVDSFFIISGFLITSSYLNTNNNIGYLVKRIARIYPGFLVCYLLCVTLVAYWGGGYAAGGWVDVFRLFIRAIFLQPPDVGPVFAGTPFPVLNGASWTIVYEFRCYLLILGLGMLRLLDRKWLILSLSLAMIAASACFERKYVPYTPEAVSQSIESLGLVLEFKGYLVGEMRTNIRFVGLFLAGASFFLFYKKLCFSRRIAALCVTVLIACLFFRPLVSLSIAFLWGYVILFASRVGDNGILAKINNKTDISYGVYLYAWPINKLILSQFPAIGIVPSGVLTFAGAVIAGYVSWVLIERPVLDAVKHVSLRKRSEVPAA
jgi:peptidoglycan/LPS O-acetylase OafA/YrhL